MSSMFAAAQSVFCPSAALVSEQRLDPWAEPPVTDCQNSRGHGNENYIGKARDDQKKIGWRAPVVVEVVDRDNAGSPGYNEEHDEGENHLKSHTRKINSPT